MSDLEIVLGDLKAVREGLYELLGSSLDDTSKDIVVQQGMKAINSGQGDGNKQIQVVNVVYNRNVHLKAISLMKVVDNAYDNVKEAFFHNQARAIPFLQNELEVAFNPSQLPEPNSLPNDGFLSLSEAYDKHITLKEFLLTARSMYALYVLKREGTKVKAAKVLDLQRTYLSRIIPQFRTESKA